MTRKIIFAIILFFFGSIPLVAQDNLVPDFALKDYNNKEFKLSDYAQSKAVVLLFVSTRCPWSNAYNERMATLAKEYSQKNVQFLGINSNQMENPEEIKTHSKENDLTFPVLKDTQNTVADQLQAAVTPEAFVLGPNRQILYQGRIDNSREEDQVTTRDLQNALDEILAGKNVTVAKTKAFGCSIKRSN